MTQLGDEAAKAAIRSWIEQQHSELERSSYYHLLGVRRDAGETEIRDAYYRLVARLHPDLYVNTLDPDTRAKLVTIYSRIVEAYRVLNDPRRREKYEAVLARGKLRLSQEDELTSARAPEDELKNPNAKRFFKLGRAALMAGDGKSAVMNLKLALSVEPGSELLRAELAKAEALLKARGG